MSNRLLGLETEYAIKRFSVHSKKIDNRIIYDCIIKNLTNHTQVVDGASAIKWHQIFTENGSAFCYESLPLYLQDGLLEAATPECESPFQLILYQKAIDRLLKKALIDLNQSKYFEKPISLIKNCKDAYGNVYGAQENYSGKIGTIPFVFFYRLFLMLYIPFLAFYIVHIFLFSFVVLFVHSFVLVVLYLFYIIFSLFTFKIKYPSYDFFVNLQHQNFLDFYEKTSGKILTFTEIVLSLPFILPSILCLNLATFRNYKKHLLSFLITRIIFTGAGTLESDGSYYLSEKATKVKRINRISNFPSERCIYDLGNLMKLSYLSALHLFKFDLIYLKQIFKKEQRLQIGMSDSCMSSEAELLKVGITSLIMDMIDDKFLKETPILKDPISSLHMLNQFPNYKEYKIAIKNYKLTSKKEMTAIEIQRWYLEKAKEYIKQKKIYHVEKSLIVKLWEEFIGLISENPSQLFGRVDWITKKILINQALLREEKLQTNEIFFHPKLNDKNLLKKHYALLKVIDLKYHDLSDGYFYELEKNGFTKPIFSDEEVERAITNPPITEKGFAWIRNKIIGMNQNYEAIQLTWNFAKIGFGFSSKIINFEDLKNKKK